MGTGDAAGVVPGAQAVVVEDLRQPQALISQYKKGARLVVVISRSWAKAGKRLGGQRLCTATSW